MSRVAVVFALGLCALAPALRAQGRADADAREARLLARAESLSAVWGARTKAAKAHERAVRRARTVEVQGVAFVVPGTVADSQVGAVADTALGLLHELGAVPRPFLEGSAIVWPGAEGVAEALGGDRYAARRRIVIGGPVIAGVAGSSWSVAIAVLRAYAETLDVEWRAWLPPDYGLQRTAVAGEARAWQTFAPGASAVGGACLSGRAVECRRWLGLDREVDPYAARYRPSELRAIYQHFWLAQGDVRGRACVAGSDTACVALAREIGQPPAVPADGGARRSLLRAVHDRYGARALAVALADTAGSLGARLARAAGVNEDALVLEWRRRALDHSGALQSRAGGKEAAPALLLAGVLLLAAAGSGRWR